MPPLLSVVGKSGVGKTTFLEKIVLELAQRGYRIGVIKHHAHTTPIDNPGKDSARYAAAGAAVVMVSSPVEVARFERVAEELSLAELAGRMDGVDLVLTEGFKREGAPKLEVSRAAAGAELVAPSADLVAVAADHPVQTEVPYFDLADTLGVADWIEAQFLKPPVEPAHESR